MTVRCVRERTPGRPGFAGEGTVPAAPDPEATRRESGVSLH